MGPIRTAIREFIDNRPERVARRRDFLRDLLNPLDVIGETDRQQGVDVERRPIRRMIANLSGIGGRIERGDPLMDVMTGSPSTTAPASTVQPVQKAAPPKVNEVIGDEDPTAPLTLPPQSPFQQTSSSMPNLRPARQSEPEGMPPRPFGRPFTMDELVMMARTNRLASPDGQQQFVGLSSIANRELERDKLDADTAKARQQYELDRQKLALTGEQINGELGLGSRKVDNEATDISNRFTLGLNDTRIRELMAGNDRFRADNDLTLGLGKLANESFDIEGRNAVQNRQVDVDESKVRLDRQEKEQGAFFGMENTANAARQVWEGKAAATTFQRSFIRNHSAAFGSEVLPASAADADNALKDEAFRAAAGELDTVLNGDDSTVKGGASGVTKRMQRFVLQMYGPQIALMKTGGKDANGNPVQKRPPREIAAEITAEVLTYMQLHPQRDFEQATMVQGMIDNLIIPRPPEKPASSRPSDTRPPVFKQ